MVFMIGGGAGLMFRSLGGYPAEQEPQGVGGEGREAAEARAIPAASCRSCEWS